MDLIIHVPVSNEFDAIYTVIDKFTKYIVFLLCSTTNNAVDLA